MAPKKQPQNDQTTLRRSSRLSTSSSAAEPPQKKQKTTPKPKTPKPKTSKPEPEPENVVAKEESSGLKKTIVVEHCKQCNAFKTRALHVKKGLEEAVEGVNVVVNPEKPRRGCFEVREEDGEAFVTLLDMKRPFTAMKKLDMDQVVADIVQRIK